MKKSYIRVLTLMLVLVVTGVSLISCSQISSLFMGIVKDQIVSKLEEAGYTVTVEDYTGEEDKDEDVPEGALYAIEASKTDSLLSASHINIAIFDTKENADKYVSDLGATTIEYIRASGMIFEQHDNIIFVGSANAYDLVK